MEALALVFISPSHFPQDEDQVKAMPGAVWHFETALQMWVDLGSNLGLGNFEKNEVNALRLQKKLWHLLCHLKTTTLSPNDQNAFFHPFLNPWKPQNW